MISAEGLDSLIADLTDAPRKMQLGARDEIERGARRLRDDARRFAPSGPHLPSYPDSITYDVDFVGAGRIEAEIGPDKSRRQGALGNLLEYGSVHNAPLSHLGPALDLEGPRLEKGLADIDDGL